MELFTRRIHLYSDDVTNQFDNILRRNVSWEDCIILHYCGRITATNIGIFASFAIANNFSSPCAPSLIAVRLVKPAGLSINGCSHSKIKSCVTSENRKLGCRDLKSFTWFSQILLFSFSLKKTKGGSDHRLIVSLMRTFDCILVKVVFLYICLRCVQGRTLIFKARS